MAELNGVYCPMGCGETLYEYYGELSCKGADCPRPTATAELLSAPQPWHVAILSTREFHLEHPLHERVDGELFNCALNRWLKEQARPPMPPGRYHVTRVLRAEGPTWEWERIYD